MTIFLVYICIILYYKHICDNNLIVYDHHLCSLIPIFYNNSMIYDHLWVSVLLKNPGMPANKTFVEGPIIVEYGIKKIF